MVAMSSRFSGSRSRGSVRSAWRPRNEANAAPVRARTAAKLSGRAWSIDCWRAIGSLGNSLSAQMRAVHNCLAARFLRGQILGLADHRDQQAALTEAFRGAAGVVDRDR